MIKKDIKLSKGKLIEIESSEVAAGESLIRETHWSKLKSKKSEKEIIKFLKAEEDKRDSKAVEK